MAELILTDARMEAGTWQGRLQCSGPGAGTPRLSARHGDSALPGLEVSPVPGRADLWTVTLPVPAALLSDGVQTVTLLDEVGGERIAAFTIATGAPEEFDLRAEIDLLRAELDLLKRAFRRHCAETA